MKKIPMLERFAAQSLVEDNGELIFSKEKFAELIVRECIEVIDMTHGSKKLMRPDPYQKIIWAIEEHFGVEESEEDSACPLCGEDGGTTCGMPGCQY